jgi:hypothetical protein
MRPAKIKASLEPFEVLYRPSETGTKSDIYKPSFNAGCVQEFAALAVQLC